MGTGPAGVGVLHTSGNAKHMPPDDFVVIGWDMIFLFGSLPAADPGWGLRVLIYRCTGDRNCSGAFDVNRCTFQVQLGGGFNCDVVPGNRDVAGIGIDFNGA